jgi:hypothetical protein
MPTPRKTLEELAASGTLGKNLGRYRNRLETHVASATPIGRAPSHLNSADRAIWAEITRTSAPGLLQKTDRLAVEALVRLVGKMRAQDVKTSDLNALINLLGRLGLSPLDRLKFDLPPVNSSTEDDEWADFDN